MQSVRRPVVLCACVSAVCVRAFHGSCLHAQRVFLHARHLRSRHAHKMLFFTASQELMIAECYRRKLGQARNWSRKKALSKLADSARGQY